MDHQLLQSDYDLLVCGAGNYYYLLLPLMVNSVKDNAVRVTFMTFFLQMYIFMEDHKIHGNNNIAFP